MKTGFVMWNQLLKICPAFESKQFGILAGKESFAVLRSSKLQHLCNTQLANNEMTSKI